jgi:hypothetical protein
MQADEPTCIDCDHAFELPDDITAVACSIHNDFRDAARPADCGRFAPRPPLDGGSGTEVRHDDPA